MSHDNEEGERGAFERWATSQGHYDAIKWQPAGPMLYVEGDSKSDDVRFVQDEWEAWLARSRLAPPSTTPATGEPVATAPSERGERCPTCASGVDYSPPCRDPWHDQHATKGAG